MEGGVLFNVQCVFICLKVPMYSSMRLEDNLYLL